MERELSEWNSKRYSDFSSKDERQEIATMGRDQMDAYFLHDALIFSDLRPSLQWDGSTD